MDSVVRSIFSWALGTQTPLVAGDSARNHVMRIVEVEPEQLVEGRKNLRPALTRIAGVAVVLLDHVEREIRDSRRVMRRYESDEEEFVDLSDDSSDEPTVEPTDSTTADAACKGTAEAPVPEEAQAIPRDATEEIALPPEVPDATPTSSSTSSSGEPLPTMPPPDHQEIVIPDRSEVTLEVVRTVEVK